jgi:SNF2 family DNA or RNA helicase
LAAVHIELEMPVGALATGMQAGLARPAKIETRQAVIELPSPRVISLPFGKPPVLKTKGFVFPTLGSAECGVRSAESGDPLSSRASSAAGQSSNQDRAPQRRTRIKPPADVIKLEDRLFYVLQPPVESWMTREALAFPFKPFPYQFEGIAFLYPRHAAVLADEMGLGKTMQAITAIRLLLHGGEVRSVLLICPKPLVTNWRREFEQWAPEVPLVVIEGEQARRRFQWTQPCPVRIANYELLGRDRDVVADAQLHFDLVVLDESQRIKNRASGTAQTARAISRRRSWALTGTPVENSSEDLLGIFEFVAPGYLKPQMKPRALGKAVGEYVLRRTKDMVLADMPPKMFRDVEIELTPEQRETYRLAEEEGVVRLTAMGDEATIQHVFELVLRLKQICNFDPATGSSAKLERLAADLEEVVESGRKAIVFSQWVGTLKRLAGLLTPHRPLEYHGGVASRHRDRVIERFRQDGKCHVLLISYGAGGVGLNLQFAQYVFLFDRWWNPAVEDQAINRAHRIGVTAPVTVSRFISLGTIEQRIDEILREKRDIFDTIFSEAGTPSRRELGLTQEEIFGLFKLQCKSSPLRGAA